MRIILIKDRLAIGPTDHAIDARVSPLCVCACAHAWASGEGQGVAFTPSGFWEYFTKCRPTYQVSFNNKWL